MKYLRACLLILLATLLPIRGVMAGTMPCADEPPHERGVGISVGHEMHDHHAMANEDADDGADSGTMADCHLCASGCHATPLAASLLAVAEPRLSTTVEFPALKSPVPSFVPEGLDRPPRSR